jgi:hypothetical protein
VYLDAMTSEEKQSMPLSKVDENNFIVRESKTMLIMISIICFVLFFFSVLQFTDGHLLIQPLNILNLFILPSVIFFFRAMKRKIIILINERGFFHEGKKVTDWDHFVSARVTQAKAKFMSFQDNFVLQMEYEKPDDANIYRSTIPLGNTQNKSEEEVIAAIKKYCKSDDPE